MIWGTAASAPAIGFWGVLLLGALLGATGVLISRRRRPGALALACMLLGVLVPLVALAAGPRLLLPHTFANGTVADATQVNGNFIALSQALQSSQMGSAGTGPTAVSVGNTVIVGSTSQTFTGALGGSPPWLSLQSVCQTYVIANGGGATATSSSAHICFADEVFRSLMLTSNPSFGAGNFRYIGTVVSTMPTGSIDAKGSTITSPTIVNDCQAWSSSSSSFASPALSLSPGAPSFETCDVALSFLCCDTQAVQGL
jgi:hypothetical protein